MRSIRAVVVVLAVSLAVEACGSGTNLPTHRDWGGASPLAIQGGRLAQSGDCVSLVDDTSGGSWLVVWQPGTSRDGSDIFASGGGLLAEIGDDVSIVGGEYDPVAVESQLSHPIPTECQTSHYWLVGDLTVTATPAPSR